MMIVSSELCSYVEMLSLQFRLISLAARQRARLLLKIANNYLVDLTPLTFALAQLDVHSFDKLTIHDYWKEFGAAEDLPIKSQRRQ